MSDWAEHAALLGLTAEQVAKITDDAFADLIEQIKAGVSPQEAIDSVIATFAPAYRDVLAVAFTETLGSFVGSAELVSFKVGDMALSQKLYAFADKVSLVVKQIVTEHAAGFQDARKLALELFEGYGFNPEEPLVLNKNNPKLPKYLRELLGDPAIERDLKLVMAKIQAGKIKTAALQASYLELIDAIEKKAGDKFLEKKLNVAFNERMRQFADRIAQTELHRAWIDKQADEIMADDSIEVLKVEMSSTHPKIDICDLFARQNKYGLGPGLYPKALAPKPPFHPYCRCSLISKRLISAKNAKLNPNSERDYLRSMGDDGAAIIGSRAKLQAALDGTPVEAILNTNKAEVYWLKTVG